MQSDHLFLIDLHGTVRLKFSYYSTVVINNLFEVLAV